jgi:diguanylate cyclase (GGDEF)-like protein
MFLSKFSLNSVPLLGRARVGSVDKMPGQLIVGPLVEHGFEALSQLYCELALKVTEVDILHRLAQVLPQIIPCDRLSYAVPQAHQSTFHVIVFDGTIASPLSFPLALESSSLSQVMVEKRVLVQRTNSVLYDNNAEENWVSCHIPLMIDGKLDGILNIASTRHLNDVQRMLPIWVSLGQFLSQTFTRIQNQAQMAQVLQSQAMQASKFSDRLNLPGLEPSRSWHLGPLKPFALLFVNLDEVRVIPEDHPRDLSHEALAEWGDRLQEQVTDSLNAQLREGDLISRMGNTEFVIALRSDPLLNVPQVAARLANVFDQPLFLGQQGFQVSCSIGISFYPEDGKTADELIKKADLAMHEAKSQGMGQVKLYRSEVSDAISRRLQIEQGLTHPDLSQYLSIVYQPQWDCLNDQLYGFECLVRWEHPELGTISPAEFIPIAEELGCIQTITHLALAQALKLTRHILDVQGLFLRPSINVSATEFEGMQALYEMTDRLLQTYQLPGDVLTIELTERVFLEQSETIMAHMNQFQARGIRISLDDFGTGFSSLSYLLDLPLNALKIDRAFVQNIDQDRKRRGVVQAIAAMAKSLDMRCIAEGVETHAELDCLQKFGCSIIQGHIVAPALSADSFLDFISASLVRSSMNPS